MGSGVRVLRAGSDGLLAEVADLDEALALFASLRDDPVPGVWELVPAARTVLVRLDPLRADAAAVADALRARSLISRETVDGPLVEVPVRYDGADLAEVASLCGLSAAEVVRRHTAAPWTVAFTGFAPGFAYLSGGDPALDVPRRREPRTSIPAGSVGLAGRFSGVYPRATPGGWQLLGTTGARMWDLGRDEPALLSPGMRVRFVETDHVDVVAPAPPVAAEPARPALEVLEPGPLSVVVDLGRPGRAAQGVACSGAVDRGSLRRANRLVGNPAGTPALEVALGGLRVRALTDLVVAVTGAEVAAPTDRAFGLDRDEELVLPALTRGLLGYLALAGGVAAPEVLGSASSDLLAGIGLPPLRAGDVVGLGTARDSAAALQPDPGPRWPAPDEVTTIDVLLGPRQDWVTPEGLRRLLTQEWTVTPRTNRIGIRLAGDLDVAWSRTDELPSEGTVPGSVQVPANGQPVVFTADHPVTGGYPVVACVVREHQDLLGQVPIGGRIRFRAVER